MRCIINFDISVLKRRWDGAQICLMIIHSIVMPNVADLEVIKPGARRPQAGGAWFLEIILVRTSVCVCVCVCPPPGLLKAIHVK